VNLYQRLKRERATASIKRLKTGLSNLSLDEIIPFKERCMCRLYEAKPHYRAQARGYIMCPVILYGNILKLYLNELSSAPRFELEPLLEKCKCD